MSTVTVDRAFALRFPDDIRHAVQQGESRLLNTVTIQMTKGTQAAHFDILPASSDEAIITRFATITPTAAQHKRRQVTMQGFRGYVHLDQTDKLQMLYDPKSRYMQSIVKALNRRIDKIIIDAVTADAVEVSSDPLTATTSNVALPTSQIVDEDFGSTNSNLTVAKLREAHKILAKNEALNDGETAYLILNASAEHALLSETETTSADYNTTRTLVGGSIDTFLGFKFIRTELLNGTADGTDADPVLCLAYVPSAIGFALSENIITKIDELPKDDYAVQVYAKMHGGATRIEDEKVVSIQCVQSA